MAPGSTRAVTRWTSRIIPVILAGCVGLATYVVTDRVCVQYLLKDSGKTGAAIALLVLHSFFLAFVIITYLRVLVVINKDPGVVPLPPAVEESRKNTPHNDDHDIEAQYHAAGPDTSPDSPGLERFYSKDIFVCSSDGRPIWCSACSNWKPDRAHHSSEMNRCVRKMDHYCPWVGGMVSETSYKFFLQFTFYATLYCAVVLGAGAYTIGLQSENFETLDSLVIAIVAMSGFFGLFTFSMTATTLRFILINLTNVDVIRHKERVYQLAIRVPRGSQPTAKYGIITYPLPRPGETTGEGAHAARDSTATRTFAVVRTAQGENPWHLGYYQNWVSVMGTNLVDWLLPIRDSPCCHEENNESFYRVGPLYQALRVRYHLPELPPGDRGIELGEMGLSRT